MSQIEPSHLRLDFRDPLMPDGLTLATIDRVITATTLAEMPAAMAALEEVWAAGETAIGFVAYEAAPAFDAALVTAPPGSDLPLLWFAVGEPGVPEPLATGAAPPLALQPDWDQDIYCRKVARVLTAIRDGETYQLNLSFPLRGQSPNGDLLVLYQALQEAQQADFSACLRTPQWQILSVSPELFFRIENGRLESRPMKGTRRRGRTKAEDEALAAELPASEKERAENVMIVDLLRNDIGRVATSGSVTVPELFKLERYPTVWQMTSRVHGQLRQGAGLMEIFAALFPCGSVTGAPKARTMAWIEASEEGPRGVYCGAIGALLPGRQALFNVPIRTLTIAADGSCRYPVGSGVVSDAVPEQEYRECLAKAAVLGRASRPTFRLLETIRWEPEGGYILLAEHMDRLTESAAFFGWEIDPLAVRKLLMEAELSGPSRVRLLVGEKGECEVQTFALGDTGPAPVRLIVADKPVDSEDFFLYHKTTHRAVYEPARRQLAESAADDVLLYNESGEVTETTIGNVAARFGEQWLTPPVSCGLLAGTQRAVELRRSRLQERVISLKELALADEIAVMNSVRGWQSAVIVS